MGDMKLSFTHIPAMLSLGIVAIGFDLMGRKYPVANHIAPNGNPNDDIATGGLDLLEIHPESLGRIGGECLDKKWCFYAGINSPGSLDLDTDLAIQQKIILAGIAGVELLGGLDEFRYEFLEMPLG